jgi:hypothetical protein
MSRRFWSERKLSFFLIENRKLCYRRSIVSRVYSWLNQRLESLRSRSSIVFHFLSLKHNKIKFSCIKSTISMSKEYSMKSVIRNAEIVKLKNESKYRTWIFEIKDQLILMNLWDYVENNLLTNISIVSIKVNNTALRQDLDRTTRSKFVVVALTFDSVFVLSIALFAARVVVHNAAVIVNSRRKSLKIVNLLRTCLRYNDKNLIKNELNVKKAWRILKKAFSCKNFEILQNLMNIIIFITMINSKDVTNYVRRFKQKMQNVRKITI